MNRENNESQNIDDDEVKIYNWRESFLYNNLIYLQFRIRFVYIRLSCRLQSISFSISPITFSIKLIRSVN
jgi:hypothetical protein